jgi:dynein light chain roadblock-type
VEGYVICNKQGQVLRRFPTMTQEKAEQYSEAMMSLSSQARSVVRDLNPKVNSQFMKFLTILLIVE